MSSPASLVLRAIDLGKIYPHASGPVEVLRGVNLELHRGEMLAVVGKSGVGKSTLLHLLGTLDPPTDGTLEILGQDVATLDDVALSSFRNRHLGFVFQFHHLLPEFTALENAALPGMIHGGAPAEARQKARAILERVGLAARLQHKPSELSGGEQQRVALARALVMSPDLILADEPTGNLDPRTGVEVHEILLALCRDLGTTVLLATHNPDLAARCDRTLHLYAGGALREA